MDLLLGAFGLMSPGAGVRRQGEERSAELVDLPESLVMTYPDLAAERPDEFAFEVREALVVLVEGVPVDLVPD